MDGDYRRRLADSVLADMVAAHQAILIVGPRSTGKTTTGLRQAASSLRLANGRAATALRADPGTVLEGMAEPILIDEWQIVPECLNAVKEQVDRESRRGQFVLTGSVRGDLDSPMWPGTGRLVRLQMFGMTEREIEDRTGGPSWLDRVLAGDDFYAMWSDENIRSYVERALRSGFPEPALRLDAVHRHQWLASYVDQLVTRDAAEVDNGRDPHRLRRYLEALALNSAGIVDDTTLWEAARINKGTARAYDTLLQNLLVVDNVPAWTANRLKRLVLAPKRYLVDSGLFAGALGLTVNDVITDGDLLGRVLDTFVTAQLRAELSLSTPQRRLSHLRLPQGRHEIDLIIEVGGGKIVAIEIKATASPSPDDIRHLRWLQSEMGRDVVVASILFHTGPTAISCGDGILGLPISTLWAQPPL
jgi:uncharacterized protein